jgi:hypothetical protein
MSSTFAIVVSVVLLVAINGGSVEGHGMMIDPPQRSSMHDHGFPSAPSNPNANSLNCGGAQVFEFNSSSAQLLDYFITTIYFL